MSSGRSSSSTSCAGKARRRRTRKPATSQAADLPRSLSGSDHIGRIGVMCVAGLRRLHSSVLYKVGDGLRLRQPVASGPAGRLPLGNAHRIVLAEVLGGRAGNHP
jgi:hypothetical protein